MKAEMKGPLLSRFLAYGRRYLWPLFSLALLFMVLRSTSTAQTGQVSGMAQSVGYALAAVGPVAIGLLHDLTGSWTVAMAVLALALIPQALSALLAAKNVTVDAHQESR